MGVWYDELILDAFETTPHHMLQNSTFQTNSGANMVDEAPLTELWTDKGGFSWNDKNPHISMKI